MKEDICEFLRGIRKSVTYGKKNHEIFTGYRKEKKKCFASARIPRDIDGRTAYSHHMFWQTNHKKTRGCC
jgi:hypothetical protein